MSDCCNIAGHKVGLRACETIVVLAFVIGHVLLRERLAVSRRAACAVVVLGALYLGLA